MNDLTMLVRYAMMILTGYLVNRGLIDSSIVEPMIGFGIALAALIWKKLEARAGNSGA